MTEVENQLYAEDENNPTKSHMFQTNMKYRNPQKSKPARQNIFTKRQQYNWENRLCFLVDLQNIKRRIVQNGKYVYKRKKKATKQKKLN